MRAHAVRATSLARFHGPYPFLPSFAWHFVMHARLRAGGPALSVSAAQVGALAWRSSCRDMRSRPLSMTRFTCWVGIVACCAISNLPATRFTFADAAARSMWLEQVQRTARLLTWRDGCVRYASSGCDYASYVSVASLSPHTRSGARTRVGRRPGVRARAVRTRVFGCLLAPRGRQCAGQPVGVAGEEGCHWGWKGSHASVQAISCRSSPLRTPRIPSGHLWEMRHLKIDLVCNQVLKSARSCIFLCT